MQLLKAYIPMDRRHALARVEPLPNRTFGTTLFADISGFTPLTEAYLTQLGDRRGTDELTKQINRVLEALISQIHAYGGSVITFGGDAITCWFDTDDGLRATAAGLAMQQLMRSLAYLQTPNGDKVALSIKIAIAGGVVRRFLVGDSGVQYLDVLAGATLDRMADTEKQAERDEVVLSPEVAEHLADQLIITAWRGPESRYIKTARFAVVAGLRATVPTMPWQVEILLQEAQIRSWVLPPVWQRLQNGPDQFLAEIRPAVVMFLKFDGLDYDHDEDAGEKLDAYIRWVQQVLVRHDSYIMQLITGDKGSYLYALFGIPVTHDDDAARAVAAALELRSLPGELNFIKTVQIGLDRGRMRAGAYGGTARVTYGALGDAANVAARLMSEAKNGQILVTQPLSEATQESYFYKYLNPIKVKGKQEAIGVSLALGQRLLSAPKRFLTYRTPLIGRTEQLQQMEQVLETMLTGYKKIIRLEGTTGIGKSHLAAEFADRAMQRGVQVIMGSCQSVSRDIIYYPWRQVFRTLLGLLDDSLLSDAEERAARTSQQIAQLEAKIKVMDPIWLLRLPLLGDLLDLPIPDNNMTVTLPPQLRQEALFSLAEKILKVFARQQPLLILIEDSHWIDEASREMLLSFCRLADQTPILFMLVERPPVSSSDRQALLVELNRLSHYHNLSLSELSPHSVAELVRCFTGGPVDTLAVNLIQIQAHGNPFFTEELTEAMQSSQSLRYNSITKTWRLSDHLFDTLKRTNCLVKRDGQWVLAENAPISATDLGLPNSIHSIVLSRFDRLPDPSKITLKVASVIGRVFEFDLLTLAHPAKPDQATLLAQTHLLQERDFIQGEPSQPLLAYMFKHNITREVTYETLLEQQERILHEAIAQALEILQPQAIERLAYHYSRTDDRDKTLFYLDKAAHKAQSESANETALRYYTQALTLEERWTWRKGQVEVLHILGERDPERESLQILSQNPATPPFAVAYLWGQYYEAIGDYPQAIVTLKLVLATYPPVSPLFEEKGNFDLLGQIHCIYLLGLVAYRQGEYQTAKLYYRQALDLLEELVDNGRSYTNEELRMVVQALNGLGMVCRQQGEFEQAIMHHEDALELSQETSYLPGQADAFKGLGVVYGYQSRFAEAVHYGRQALNITQKIGDRPNEGVTLTNLATTALSLGDYGLVQKYSIEALELLQATGNRWAEINTWMGLGGMYQELGDLNQAEICLQRGLQLGEDIGDDAGRAYVLLNLGLVLREQHKFNEAIYLLAIGLTLAESQEDKVLVSYYLIYLATVFFRQGDWVQALTHSQDSLAIRAALDLNLIMIDNLALIAAIYLGQGELAQALAQAQEVSAMLEACGGEGPEFPLEDYWLCYQVFMAHRLVEAATQALKRAYDLLQVRVEKIMDKQLRQSFLEQVAINRQIMAAWQSQATTNGEINE